MINKLRVLNEKLINNSFNNPRELEKQRLIQKILQEKNCFLKMDIQTAYALLQDLKIPKEEIKNVYLELINIEK